MHARDIPVVGGILDAVADFGSTLARIARQPFGFVHTIGFGDPREAQRAFRFIGAAIAFAYVIFSPALTRHGSDVSELLFGLFVLLRLLLILVIYHAAFLIVGCRQPMMTTLILGSYINGIYFPFFMAVMLPAYLVVGPEAYFNPLVQHSLTAQQIQDLDTPLVRTAQFALFAAFPFFYTLTAYWWAKAYGVRTWLSAVLLLVSLALAAVANVYFLPSLVRPLL